MPLTDEEYTKLLDAVPLEFTNGTATKVRACIQLMRWSGLAVRDATVLDTDELLYSAKKKTYHVLTSRQKTGAHVMVPIPPVVALEILAVKHSHPKYFFMDPRTATPVSTALKMSQAISKVFTRACIHSKGHMRSHRLRDTFAVDLLIKGVPMEEVSKLLGHENISTTERHYAKWVKGRQDRLDSLVTGTWDIAFIMLLATSACVFASDYNYTEYTTLTYNTTTQTLTQTVNVSGYSNGTCTHPCGPNGQTCTDPNCANASHTLTITNVLGNQGGDTVSTLPMYGTLNVSSIVNLSFPPGSQVFGSTGAAAKAGVKIFCSFIGAIFWSTPTITDYVEEAYTRSMYITPTYGQRTIGGVPVQNYTVESWCSVPTTPPDANPVYVTDGVFVADTYTAWEGWSTCIRQSIHATWSCDPSLEYTISHWENSTMLLGDCTSHPPQ